MTPGRVTWSSAVTAEQATALHEIPDEFTPQRVGGHGKDKICLLTFGSRIKVMLCA